MKKIPTKHQNTKSVKVNLASREKYWSIERK